MPAFPCSAVRIAHTGMNSEEIIANILEGMTEITKIVPRGWTNIQSLNIKSSNSVALPIHTSLPDNVEMIETELLGKKRKVTEGSKTGKKNKRKRLEVEHSKRDDEDSD